MNTFENSLLMLLQKTIDAIIPKYRLVFKQYKISEQQWRILSVLAEHKKCTTLDLSSRTLIPGPSLVGIIDRMSKKDLVMRDRSSEDRRVIFVQLSEKGADLFAELSPQIERINEQVISTPDSHDLKCTINTLKALINPELALANGVKNPASKPDVPIQRVEAKKVEALRVEAETIEIINEEIELAQELEQLGTAQADSDDLFQATLEF